MKRFSTLAILAASDLAIGFAVQVFVLLAIGIGASTDAYYAGQAPPLVLLTIIQLPLQRAVVVSFASGASERPAAKLLSAAMTIMGALMLVLSLIAPVLIAHLYSELPHDAQATAVDVLRIQGLAVVVGTGNMILLGLNHVDGRFVQCEMAMVAASVAAGVFVVLALPHMGVIAASYGQLVKAVACGALYLLVLRSRLTWGRPPWREVWQATRPMVSAGALTKLAPVIDRSIASAAPHGSISMLVLAQAMYGAATGIAERSFIAPRLPALKVRTLSNEPLSVAGQLAWAGAVVAVALVSLAMTVRAFDATAGLVSPPMMDLLIAALACLAGFPIAALSVQWMAAAMTIMGRPQLSAKIVAWGFVASVPLKLVGFWLGGIYGLALAMSCYYLCNAAAFVLVLRNVQRPPHTEP